MSLAKTTLYSNLEDIRTARLEKRRGYGRLLLNFIEKNALNHHITSMSTSDFNACNVKATNFFKNGHYTVDLSAVGLGAPVKATKFFK